jgi:branched-subunit amino acid ABC-type transport system permease component
MFRTAGPLIIGILSVIITFYPGLRYFYLSLMVVVLLFKPVGLLGRK